MSLRYWVSRVLLIAALSLLSACGSWSAARPGPSRGAALSVSKRREMHAALSTMARSWDAMGRGRAKSRREAEEAYETALAEWMVSWSKAQKTRDWPSELILEPEGFSMSSKTDSTRFVIEWEEANPKRHVHSPREFDALIPAEAKIWRGRETQALRSGLGVPLIGRVLRDAETLSAQPFLPPKGGHYALTAVMEFRPREADGTRRCRLHLLDSLNAETVTAPIGMRQLAADYTAPKEQALARRAFGDLSITGMLRPERALNGTSLCCIDPYDPQRIPVVFVHGLLSDPHIWMNAVNAISADPKLRRAYQPWYFMYPTALSVPQAATHLREALLRAREHYDPEHDDPGFSQMVLVGHSMGGLVSRMQVTESEDALWKALFTLPPDRVHVSPATRSYLEKSLIVKPLPFATRVIFIATPHRGSRVASLDLVRGLSGLIRLPLDTARLAAELLQGHADALSPQITQWGVYSFLSLGTLSERSPLLHGLDRTRPSVRHHSIIGNSGFTWLSHEKTNDGVVTYRSSHLDTAASEKVVPYLHSCSGKPEVVKEITRILHEHLRSARTQG